MSLLAHRTRPLWLAALVHRLSGLALAIFLPFHFLALGLAISGEAPLESFLRWTDQPLVKVSESLVLGVLAVHMLGGLRLLALENLAWREGQTRLALLAIAAAMIVCFSFLASVF
jgi:fumarate reductase subunit D